MGRFFFFGAALALIIGSVAVVRWSGDPPPSSAPVATVSDDLVGLPDGSTLIAGHGTVTRDLTDWLQGTAPGKRTFELGGHQFIGHSDEMTPESGGRLPRLIAMLRAYPDVDLIAVGHAAASGNAKEEDTLARARAEGLVQALTNAGISATRLSVESRGAKEPLPDMLPESEHNDRVTLTLTRRE